MYACMAVRMYVLIFTSVCFAHATLHHCVVASDLRGTKVVTPSVAALVRPHCYFVAVAAMRLLEIGPHERHALIEQGRWNAGFSGAGRTACAFTTKRRVPLLQRRFSHRQAIQFILVAAT